MQAQHKLSTYTAHKSITEAIRINTEVIAGRTSFFEKQAVKKPLMFQKTKIIVAEFNRLSNNVSKYIEEIQSKVNTEQVLYDMLTNGFYKNILFQSNNELTFKGDQLKIKIDSLYNYSIKMNVHKLSQISNFADSHFKTSDVFYDFDENELNYFQHLFYDKSNYGIMMSMNCLLLDVKTFQLLYYGTVMSY
ncbi:hypothetical protein [Tenacibaculum soleae]|uniref:hypothetical protein n=1 Tax=Tenacibaculum soleae TaxID=447689 RepID=UPI002301EAA9|nr:hypothetical protein [Tenacibaculum soleae]